MKKLLLLFSLIMMDFCVQAQSPITMQFKGLIPGISDVDSIGYTYTGAFPGIRYLYNAKKVRQVIQSYITTTVFDSTQFRLNVDTIHLLSTGVGAGTCTNCNLTILADGRVSIKANGTGGGGTWGTITGTLSSQTDLQSALNAKQPSFVGTGYSKFASGTLSYVTAIPNADLANSTISGVSLGNSLFAHTAGYGITGSNYNGGAAQTWVLDTASSNAAVSKSRLATNLGGYVKSIAVTTGNGVSGTSSGGQTPSLSFTLGNITPTTISTTIKPATIYQTPLGTAGTDSVMVKHSGGTVSAIPANYYSTSSGGLTTANSGLSVSGTTAQFGGSTLLQNSTITNGAYLAAFSDSLSIAAPTFHPGTLTGTIIFWGNSIDFGQGASPSSMRYSTQVANYFGLTENNQGQSGSAVEHRTPFSLPASTDYIARESNVPSYSGTTGPTKILVIDCGPNDFYANSANYNPTNYTTDLTSFINYCTGTAGWPSANILLIGNTYLNPALYTGGLLTSMNYQLFITASQTVATNLGIQYVNPWDWFNRQGAMVNTDDGIHPNNRGYTLLAQLVEAAISKNTAYRAANAFKFINYSGANGVVSNLKQNLVSQNAEFSNIKLDNKFLVNQSVGTKLLGLDSLNNIGAINFLPTGTLMYSPKLVGNLTDYFVPIGGGINWTLGTYDFGFAEKKIYTQSLSIQTLYSTTQLLDVNGGFNFTNTLTGGGLPLATFSNATGSGMQIYENGTTINGSLTVPFGTFGIISGNNSYGGYIPFNSSLNSILYNVYSQGNLQFDVSQGVNNTYYTGQQIAVSGSSQFFAGGSSTPTTANDNGIGIDDYGTARSQLGSGFGVLGVVLMPSAPTPSGSGGTLSAATYYAKVVALDAYGNQTNQPAEINSTTTGTTSSIAYTWTTLTNAVSYRIYIGTSSNGENKYLSTSGTSITDIGSGYTTATLPKQNTTYMANISSSGNFYGVFPAYSSGGNSSLVVNSTTGRIETGSGGGGVSVGNPSGLITFTASNGSAATALRTDGLHAIDSTIVRPVANSYSLAGMQTKLNNYVLSTALLNHIAGFGLSGSNYNTLVSQTWQVDTSGIRTVNNSRTLAQTQTALNLKANIASPTFTTPTLGVASITQATFAAGTTTVAPIVLTSGTDLTSAASGSFEFNGTRLAFSPSTTRKRITLTNDVAPTNGQIPIGNGTDYTVATLTGTTNEITVTNTSGVITLATPQPIATGSSPQFTRMGLGVAQNASTTLMMAGGATGVSQIRFNTGVAPTSPVTGDLWRVSGSQIQFYDGTLTNNIVMSQNSQVIILASSNTTLVAGTKAISVTGVTTSSHAFVNAVSQGGTVSTTFEYAAVCTSGTLTITALTTGNVTNTLDTSTVNYFITN